MALRRRQLMVRYEPLSALWDGGHLCPVLGIPKLSGSWFEIGRGIADIGGSNKFAAEVVAVIQRSKPEHRVAMFEQARRAFDHARRFIPGIGELIEGMAAGTGLPTEQLILAHFVTALDHARGTQSCSAIGWITPAGPIVGQALDLGLSNDTTTVMVAPEEGVSFLCHMNVGSLWFSTGINRHGVVIAGASVNARKQVGASPPCLAHPFIDLMLLGQASSAEDAVHRLRDAMPCGGPGDASTHLIADRREMYVVEVAGTHCVARRQPQVVVNNHFELDSMPALEADDDRARTRRHLSVQRRASGLRFLSQPGDRDVTELTEFLQRGETTADWFRSAIHPDDGWTTARHLIDVPGQRFLSWHGPYQAKPRTCVLSLQEVFGTPPEPTHDTEPRLPP